VLLFINAALGLALAPIGLITGGVVGFIVTHIIAQVVGVIFLNFRLQQKFQTHPDYRAFLKLLGSTMGASALALAIGFVGTGLPSSVLLVTQALIFLVAALILLPITGAITRDDLQNMRRFAADLSIVGVIIMLLIRIEHWVMRVTQRGF
jgi:peptidoglycan biosynthesis protein MviN/MurJ (putative lipid II flippase)